MLKIKQPMNQLMNKKGFTLVELIVVIAIIAILAAILIPVVTNYVSDARQAAVDANAQTFALALQTTFADLIGSNDIDQAEALLDALEDSEIEGDPDAAEDWTDISEITDESAVLASNLGTNFDGYVIVNVDGTVAEGIEIIQVHFTTEESDAPNFIGIYPR